jgi:hypothetical protein
MPNLNSNGKIHDLGDDASPLTEFIRPTDEAHAVPCPTTIGELWVEKEYGAAQGEQRHAYAQKGEEEACPAHTTAAGLAHEADKAIGVSNNKDAQAAAAGKQLQSDEAVLGPHERRPTDAKLLKWGRWILLVGGDLVGVAGAALLLGELPINAFMQAISAAVSAVTLGGVGREVRYLMAARIRQKSADELSAAEQPYAAWFSGPNTAEVLVKIVSLVCLTGIVLIAGGIFALRDAAEGLGPALTFGCLALALGLASFYNSFDTADDIAEHLDSQTARVKKLDKAAEEARKDPTIRQRAEAQAEEESVRAANTEAGEAAADGLDRELFHVFGVSPGVVGNGLPARPNNHRGGNNHRPKRNRQRSEEAL